MTMKEKFKEKFQLLKNKYHIKDDAKFCVALSGGADSMALLNLMIDYIPKKNILAATIDHKLRECSQDEAVKVSNYCMQLGINHEILVWDHAEIESAIQEKARKARYSLLSDFCQKNKVDYLSTAHHFDDNLEQVFISLSHGSSLHSFLIPQYSVINGINVIRPLLEFEKIELVEYLNQNNINFFEDESNFSDKYLRNKIRKIVTSFKEIVDISRLKTSIENVERISNSLNAIAKNEISNFVKISDIGYATIDFKKFKNLSEEIRFSILRYTLINIGKRNSDIRLSSLKILDKNIFNLKITTLNGCKILFESGKAIFIREFGKELTNIDIKTDHIIIDDRYKINHINETSKILYLDDVELKKIYGQTKKLLNFEDNLSDYVKKSILKSHPFIVGLEKDEMLDHIYRMLILTNNVQFIKFEF